MSADPPQPTELLERIQRGDAAAAEQLVSVLYGELRAMARGQMRGERDGHTLQTTALVHEAWLRLMGGKGDGGWKDRTEFIRCAARAMRNVLVDHARGKRAQKRGEGRRMVPLDDILEFFESNDLDVLELREAVEKLESIDPQLAGIVELRYFVGLTIDETARVLGVSTPTVERGWRVAKMWLREHMSEPS